MKAFDWYDLQNGSDIRGVALEGIPGEEVNLTPERAFLLGKAFARWLERTDLPGRKIAIGTDSRLSGPSLKAAFANGCGSLGAEILDFGLASTPAMFMSTLEPDLDIRGAVMLTASHLPFNRNGMKFFTRNGGLDKGDIRALLDLAREETGGADFMTSVSDVPYMDRYAAHLVEVVRRGAAHPVHPERPLAGMHILVDAGNGAGGFFADRVLVPLGADIRGSQFLEPDGRFPNHVPNPENEDAMRAISEAVLRERAELGIIFDTDVDRAALVDSEGQAVNRNKLIALIASVVLEEHPGSVVVTDSITSSGLTPFLENSLGGVHHRFRRGYKNVINEAIRLNAEGRESWLAIETSGHAALRENHFLDDGAYLIAKLLIQAARMRMNGRTLETLIRDLREPEEAAEFRIGILAGDFRACGERVLEDLKVRAGGRPEWTLEEPNYEGIRVRSDHPREMGWFLLRLSLHDPVLPLNVESETDGGVDRLAREVKRLLLPHRELDLGSLPGLQAVLLDMDGVLLDSEHFIRQAAIDMFLEKGFRVAPEDFLPFTGMGENRFLGGVAEAHGIPFQVEADKARTYEIYAGLAAGRLRPLAGALAFVDSCRARGLRVAVASSADPVKVNINLREIGLDPSLFDAVVTGLDVANRKPAPDVFLEAARRCGADPARCLVVEDAPSGIRAAREAGCRVLGLTTSFSAPELAGAHWIAADLSAAPREVLDW
ncbi:MAG: HAD-IA family hydrolase [Bacteroidales bacterium]